MQKIGEKETEFGTYEFHFDDKCGNMITIRKADGKHIEGPVRTIQKINCVNVYEFNNIKEGKRYDYCALPKEVYSVYLKLEEERKKANLKLVYAGSPLGSKTKYYSLNQRVEPDVWNKIKKYFQYITKDDYENDYDEGIYGWNTTNPSPVEKILGMKEENTVAFREKQAEEKRKLNEEKQKKVNDMLSEISNAFVGAEYPDPKKEAPVEAAKFQPGCEKMMVEGEKVQHPVYPENIYGGGEWWVIQPRWIWHIKNNGSDGDNWSVNNVNTGGAGAIGKRIPYSEEVAEKIRGLK